jgi:uncharacterized protein YndB with AHSA1/START domain
MTNPNHTHPDTRRALEIQRTMAAPRDKIWRCWTEPALLPLWFCPKPWVVSHAELDVRSGGSSNVTMRGPEGQEVPNPGIYLAVEPLRRLVFTDAFTHAWVPSSKAFMVGEIILDDAPDGRTLYTARAMHWSDEDRAAHEKMGFYVGWGIAADQLEALAKTL